jgi:hypothetical protein
MTCADSHRVLRSLFLWGFLSVLLGLAARSTAEAADVPNRLVISAGLDQFAIADFDGDMRPDLASIQAEPDSSGVTNYWIQLQLSTFGQQSIQLFAPAGGLRVEARDVNGDHSIDLVLATAWFRQPVAILVNDGHGKFSQVEPTTFSGAFRESKTNWGSPLNQGMDALGVPPQSQARLCWDARDSLRRRSPKGFISTLSAGILTNPFLSSHAGRAPPFEVPHS